MLDYFPIQECSVEKISDFILYINPTFKISCIVQVNLNIYNTYNQVAYGKLPTIKLE